MAIVRSVLLLMLLSGAVNAANFCGFSLRKSFVISEQSLEVYSGKIRKAASNLRIEEAEFINRLQKNRMSPEKFFRLVDDYRSGKKQSTFATLVNPSKMAEMIRLRQISNPNFLFSFVSLASFHTLAQAGAHFIVDRNLEYVPLLGAQLTALLITEVALNFTSAKNAAYLVANPDVIDQAREYEKQNLKPNEKKKLGLIRKGLYALSSLKNKLAISGKEVTKGVLENFPKLFAVASLAGVLSFAGLKLIVEGDLDINRDLEFVLVNAGFHGGFISLWSSFRYQLMQGQIFPAIGASKFFSKHPVLRSMSIWGVTAVNLSMAIFTYSQGSISTNEAFGLEPIDLSQAVEKE